MRKETEYQELSVTDTLKEEDVKHLLASCELPHDDITLERLEDFIGLRDGTRLVGVIGVEIYDTVALLRSLAVLPAYRGRGLGQQLVARIEARAAARGVETLYLLTTTADRFFGRLGYAPTARDEAPPAIQETSEFSELCPASAVFMSKRLGDVPQRV